MEMNMEKIVAVLVSIIEDKEGVDISYTLERKDDSKTTEKTA